MPHLVSCVLTVGSAWGKAQTRVSRCVYGTCPDKIIQPLPKPLVGKLFFVSSLDYALRGMPQEILQDVGFQVHPQRHWKQHIEQ